MKLPVFCLLLVFCGTNSQFQVSQTESGDVYAHLASLQVRLEELEQKQQKGAVYIHWGRTTCGNAVDGLTETVYSGVAGGTHYSHPGGGTNYQCLPTEPQWGRYQDGVQGWKAFMWGAEYELDTNYPFGSASVHNHEVPCAVCYVPTRGSKLMIPARNTCPTDWTQEYHGYLMAEFYNHPGAKEFVCVDEQPEAVPGGHADNTEALFYPVEARCGSLPCPSYVHGREGAHLCRLHKVASS